MRILVTGAAGFIGWNLTRELRRRHPDAYIAGLDNLWTGRRRAEESVDRMHIGDVCHRSSLDGIFDHVYHLASPASPDKYQAEPFHTIRANVDGLWNCLGKWLMPGGTIFFASSSEVYGDPLVSPQPEDYKGHVNCTGIRACYDESKRLCETILCDWMRRFPETGVKIARLFNVYGPGTLPDDGRCMSNFIWQAMQGLPLTIYGDGLQTRCFTYVDNVVRGIVDMVEETPHDFIGPMNIGTNVETTVRDIAVAVSTAAFQWHYARGRTSARVIPPVYMPAVEDDPRQRMPHLDLALQMIGWRAGRLIQPWGTPSGGIWRTMLHFEQEYWSEDLYHEPGSVAAEPAGHAEEPAGVGGGSGGDVGAGP